MAVRKQGQREIKLIDSYKTMFSGDDGKKVLYDLMKFCHFLHNSYDPNPHKTSFNEGKRDVILYILSILGQDIDKIMKFVEQQGDLENEIY